MGDFGDRGVVDLSFLLGATVLTAADSLLVLRFRFAMLLCWTGRASPVAVEAETFFDPRKKIARIMITLVARDRSPTPTTTHRRTFSPVLRLRKLGSFISVQVYFILQF